MSDILNNPARLLNPVLGKAEFINTFLPVKAAQSLSVIFLNLSLDGPQSGWIITSSGRLCRSSSPSFVIAFFGHKLCQSNLSIN
jgi:hypothetical protein